MKAVVISGGQPMSQIRAAEILTKADYIVCADKGAEYALEYGFQPDLVVGDMDSIDMAELSAIDQSKIDISPIEKDYTDTHLAVIRALEKGADDINVICATGLRSDHGIANIRLLLFINANNALGRITDDTNVIYLCTGETVFENKEGTTISLIALSETVQGITLEGFHYPLNNYDADLGWTTGISNVITAPKAVINIKSGKLLVFEIYQV